jgi:transcriptional regulator with XRE-family HTH domain
MGWESIIGGNLRRFRKARGLTQESLAAEVDLDIRQIGRIERGESYPSVGLLVQLAEVLGVEPGAFFTPPEDPVSRP